jgi:UDP-sugar transporter A1/2/3
MMAAGGILMGLVIKHTDNIIKSFAVSITIVFTFFLSYLIFDIEISPSVYFGTYIVANSILIYNLKYDYMI